MDMVDPRLHTLRVLRSEGTVTATAAALHLTPSTVSQQLQHLAADLRLTLLEPQGRRVTPHRGCARPAAARRRSRGPLGPRRG
ncbi:helix-turn-helix domain-containing protein [Enemella evansiae]|uniref:helix-turn-helix domain-containing protein n=1 Tax=Enemella evansiae TaxID=2016499 RepID=UPI001E5FC69D|nr:LysR family transcriptional regulator [Enemella evansiae]